MQDVENFELDNNKKKMLRGLVYSNPLALTVITDQSYINYINYSLPFSIGFEIECNKSDGYKEYNITNIPYLMEFKTGSDGMGDEQRFRIPNGMVGLICLYNITEQLKNNFLINPSSGRVCHLI